MIKLQVILTAAFNASSAEFSNECQTTGVIVRKMILTALLFSPHTKSPLPLGYARKRAPSVGFEPTRCGVGDHGPCSKGEGMNWQPR